MTTYFIMKGAQVTSVSLGFVEIQVNLCCPPFPSHYGNVEWLVSPTQTVF